MLSIGIFILIVAVGIYAFSSLYGVRIDGLCVTQSHTTKGTNPYYQYDSTSGTLTYHSGSFGRTYSTYHFTRYAFEECIGADAEGTYGILFFNFRNSGHFVPLKDNIGRKLYNIQRIFDIVLPKYAQTSISTAFAWFTMIITMSNVHWMRIALPMLAFAVAIVRYGLLYYREYCYNDYNFLFGVLHATKISLWSALVDYAAVNLAAMLIPENAFILECNLNVVPICGLFMGLLPVVIVKSVIEWLN